MTKKVYKFYSDSGHGWLAVKRAELMELGILTKVSPYSYIKGETVYLEEDCDAPLFFETFVAAHGVRPMFLEKNMDGNSPIRSYPHFQP